MNNYKEVREKLVAKYRDAVYGICEANGVDIGVGFEMLLANARAYNEGTEIKYLGATDVNYSELLVDMEELYK